MRPHSIHDKRILAAPSAPQLARAGLRAFFNIAAAWGLSSTEEQILLGSPARSSYYKWKSDPGAANLSADTLERLSYIVGIYKALHILLPNATAANAWIRKPNSAPLFNGHSALDRMLSGRIIDLADVRRFLDAERG